MLKDILPSIEQSIQDSIGSIPVVFKGLARSYRKGDEKKIPGARHFYELSHVKSGVMEYEFDNNRTHEVRAGATILIRPDSPHVCRVKETFTDITTVYFGFTNITKGDRAFCRISSVSMDEFMKYVSAEDDYGIDLQPCMMIRGTNRVIISELIERIHYENSSDLYNKELMMRLLATELLVTISRALKEGWEESLLVRTGKAAELVHIAKQYMIDNFNENISVSDVAGYVFLSQGYFARAFREEMGQSPMAYLIEIRIQKSCDLLRDQDLKISSIAEQIGFASPQRFNVAFRKIMGMTPMEYRRKISAPPSAH